MERVFTKEIGRFAPGEIREYPVSVWTQIARSARMPLDKFTRPVDEAAQAAAAPKKRGES